MKQYFKSIIIFSMSVILLFVSCPFSVYASEHGGGGGTAHNPAFITDSGTINVKDDGVVMYYIEYILMQIGAIVKDHDLTKVMANDQTMKGYISKGKFDANNNTVTFPKETVVYVKECFEKHVKEHEPYYMAKTYAFDTADFSDLTGRGNVYNTIKNLLNESKSGFIVCSFDYDGSIWFADIDRNFADLSFVKVRSNERFVGIYDNETWKRLDWTVYMVRLSAEDEEIKTAAEFKEKAINTYKGNKWDYALTQEPRVLLPHDTTLWRRSSCTIYSWAPLASKEERRIRVFNEFADFQNYTLNRRSVYYTSKYYNYVPEDITTSIDDLQKTVDDLSKVIDQLLDQISKDTDESEIEELLKQILDELKNNQGGGGGSGGGGGDVTVDIDLSTTNTLLSKILAKVTQIFDKMSETAGNTMDSVVDSIKNLERMLNRYLSAITGDLDDIKGKLDQMTEEEFGEKTDSFLSETMDSFSEIGGVAKTKFPFSLPNDMRLLIERITVKPAENASLHSDTISHVTPYSGEHGGGGSTDGKPNPPGGGGASRPPGGIAYVEQGTAGECFTLSPTGAPLIRCPIVIKSRNIDFSIVIDLSEFDKVATLSRTFLTLLFVYGLLNLTFKVMGLWGDLVE